MHRLIGLVGFKQSGKSTAARYLQEKYGFVRHNFKDVLIAELEANFPDLLRYYLHLYGALDTAQLFREKPEPVRYLMMNYGTEVRRKEKSGYWVNQWIVTPVFDNNVVTDDVRFLNEAQAIKNNGGIIIRIIRTDIRTGGEHSSETEQLQIEADYTIEVGQGEHKKLYAELDAIMASWKA